MKTEADELSMPDAFRQFYLDCEGKQSIKQLCLSIKMAVSQPSATCYKTVISLSVEMYDYL